MYKLEQQLLPASDYSSLAIDLLQSSDTSVAISSPYFSTLDIKHLFLKQRRVFV